MAPSPTFDTLIQHSGLSRAEARRLLALIIRRPLTWLIAHGDAPVPPDIIGRFQDLAARWHAGEPLAYLLGQQAFYGRDYAVSPAVLIPRADTETLIEQALQCLRPLASPQAARSPDVLELGTGSGIIAITLALECPTIQMHALEQSGAALAVAQRNAATWQAKNIHWYQGNWWQALANPLPPASAATGQRFALIVANPPYIAAHDPHLEQGDLRFEPAQALVGGPDGLDDLRTIIQGAPGHLHPDGWLLLEHGYDQADAVQALLHTAGFTRIFTQPDLGGQPRVSGGQYRPGPPQPPMAAPGNTP